MGETPLPTQREWQWSVKILPLAQFLGYLREYFRILRMTNTVQFLQWNIQTVEKSMGWAKFVEQIVSLAQKDTGSAFALEIALKEEFHIEEKLYLSPFSSLKALANARSILLSKILRSPYVSTHPFSMELLHAVYQHYKRVFLQNVDTETSECPAPEIVQALAVMIRETTMSSKALDAHGICAKVYPRVPVKVRRSWVNVTPSEIWSSHPHTEYIHRCSNKLYESFLRDQSSPNLLDKCFNRVVEGINADVRQMHAFQAAALMLQHKWASAELKRIRKQLEGVLADFLKRNITRIVRDLDAWFMAIVSDQVLEVAVQYVHQLVFQASVLSIRRDCKVDESRAVVERIAVLCHQSLRLEKLCELSIEKHRDCSIIDQLIEDSTGK